MSQHETHESDKSRFGNPECRSDLVRYIRTHCRGKARERRQERMVTEILKRDQISHPTSGQLKQIRRDIREALNPGQSLIDKFAPGFLIGRSAAFTYADIDRILQRSK